MPELSPLSYPNVDVYPGIDLPDVVSLASGPLVLCDSKGSEIAELEVAHTIRFEMSRAWSVKFTLGYDQVGAAELLTMLGTQTPQLRAYRDSVLVFNGQWAPQQETADGSTQDGITCEFRSPFAQLETRYRKTARTFTATDAGQIAWGLIDDTNAVGPTGLVQGVLQTTVNKTRTYDIAAQVSQAITDLTDANVFQFTEVPLPPGSDGLASFNVWAKLGRDLTSSARFEYGETTLANVLSVERTISPPVNRAIVTGGTATTTSVVDDTGSQAAFGVYMTTASYPNVQDQGTLDDKAAALIQPTPVQQVTFEPDVRSAPQPIDDYWLGDTISFRANQFGLVITATAQVSAIEIDRDGDGVEFGHRLEFGSQNVKPLTPYRRGRHLVFRDPSRTAGSSPRRVEGAAIPHPGGSGAALHHRRKVPGR